MFFGKVRWSPGNASDLVANSVVRPVPSPRHFAVQEGLKRLLNAIPTSLPAFATFHTGYPIELPY